MKRKTEESRRNKGTGRIWFDERQGVYKGRIRIQGKDKYLTLTGNERESQALWKEFVEKEKPAAKIEKAKLPMGDVWAQVRDKIAISKGGTNVAPYWTVWHSFEKAMLDKGRKYIEDVTATDVAVYVQNAFASFASQTYNIYVSYLKRVFMFARPDMKISDNPVANLGTKAVVQESREPLTDDEIMSLLKTAKAKGDEWYRLIVLALNTGMRCKDCVHLTSDKVKDGEISVVPFKTAKKSGKRVNIPLNAALHEVLDGIEGEYFPTFRKEYEKCQPSFSEKIKHLFTEAGIQTAKQVEGRIRKTSTKGFHALRVVFISKLSEAGVSLGLIQSMAGHVSSKQTLVYTKPNRKALQNAVNTLPNFNKGETKGEEFVHPEIQQVIAACKAQIEATIEKVMGKRIEVAITPKQEILGGEDAFLNL